MAIEDRPVLSTPSPCSKCGKDAYVICATCKGPMCDEHKSPMDPNFCNLCLNYDTQIASESPLVDEEGVTHTGRVITPAGEHLTKTLPQIISEMDDYQLARHIEHYKVLVEQSKKQLDYRRIALGVAELEQEQRADLQRRKLRGVRVKTAGTVKIGGEKAKASKAEDLLSKLKATGLPEDVIKVLVAAAAAKAKNAQAKPEELKQVPQPTKPAEPKQETDGGNNEPKAAD